MKSILLVAATTLSIGFLASTARAALIPGVTATTTMGNNPAGAVNGVGLPGNVPSLTGIHELPNGPNAWLSQNGFRTGDITFDLKGSYSLAGFSFWNYYGADANPNIGIRGVTVESSTDGTNFSAIAGSPTEFAIGNSTNRSPEVISFSPVTASYVRFVVSSNWGSNFFTGFSEVQFNSFDAPPPTAVPEPATVLGLLAFGGGLLATKRR